MAGRILEVHAGKIVVFSRGEYSDYGYIGIFLALEHIAEKMFSDAVDAAKAKARAENAKETWSDGDDDYGADGYFLPEMVRRGWLMDLEYREIHTGSYGDLGLS